MWLTFPDDNEGGALPGPLVKNRKKKNWNIIVTLFWPFITCRNTFKGHRSLLCAVHCLIVVALIVQRPLEAPVTDSFAFKHVVCCCNCFARP